MRLSSAHSRFRRRALQGAVLTMTLLASTEMAIAAPLVSDFDRDGFDDLVVSIPGRAVDGIAGAFNNDPFTDLAAGAPGAFDDAGAVILYYASLTGRLVGASVLRTDMAEIDDPR